MYTNAGPHGEPIRISVEYRLYTLLALRLGPCRIYRCNESKIDIAVIYNPGSSNVVVIMCIIHALCIVIFSGLFQSLENHENSNAPKFAPSFWDIQ